MEFLLSDTEYWFGKIKEPFRNTTNIIPILGTPFFLDSNFPFSMIVSIFIFLVLTYNKLIFILLQESSFLRNLLFASAGVFAALEVIPNTGVLFADVLIYMFSVAVLFLMARCKRAALYVLLLLILASQNLHFTVDLLFYAHIVNFCWKWLSPGIGLFYGFSFFTGFLFNNFVNWLIRKHDSVMESIFLLLCFIAFNWLVNILAEQNNPRYMSSPSWLVFGIMYFPTLRDIGIAYFFQQREHYYSIDLSPLSTLIRQILNKQLS